MDFTLSPFVNSNFIIMSYDKPAYETSLSEQEGLSLLSKELSKGAFMEPAEGVYMGVKEPCIIIWNPTEEDKLLALDVANKWGQESIIYNLGFYVVQENRYYPKENMYLSSEPFEEGYVFYKGTYMRLV